MATPITPEFIEKLRTTLQAYITEMEQEREEIGNRPEGYHRSHDEMAMDDQHWDELDRKVSKVKKLLEKLDHIPVGADLSEEVQGRVAKIQELVEALSNKSAPSAAGAAAAEEKRRREEEYEAYGCKCLECLNYESEEEEDEVEQEDCRYCSGCYYCSGPGSGAGTSWNESGYFD